MTNQLPKIHSIEPCWYGRGIRDGLQMVLGIIIQPCDQPGFIKWHNPYSGKSLEMACGACINHFQLICAGCDKRATRHCPDCCASICQICVHSASGHNPPGQDYIPTGLEAVSDAELDNRLSSIGKDANGSSNSNPND